MSSASVRTGISFVAFIFATSFAIHSNLKKKMCVYNRDANWLCSRYLTWTWTIILALTYRQNVTYPLPRWIYRPVRDPSWLSRVQKDFSHRTQKTDRTRKIPPNLCSSLFFSPSLTLTFLPTTAHYSLHYTLFTHQMTFRTSRYAASLRRVGKNSCFEQFNMFLINVLNVFYNII